jgi:hypothetical protein
MADQYLVAAAAKYGVPLWVLEGIAASEGNSWDEIHPGGEVGRFGIHPVHAAEIEQQYGISWSDLPNRPDIQIDYWVPRIANYWKNGKAQGLSDEQIVREIVHNVQAPAQQYEEREVGNMMDYREAERQSMQTYEEGQPWTPTGAQPSATDADFIAWLKSHGFGVYVWTDPDTGQDMLIENPPAAVVNAYLDETTGATSGATAQPMSEYQRATLPYDIANTQALTAKAIQDLGSDEYERARTEYESLIDLYKWTAEQAATEFYNYLAAATEARARSEKIYGEKEKRAVWTTPTPYYPGTEPGGMNEQMYAEYGLGEAYKPTPGVPVETLPNPEEMYATWDQQMGVPQEGVTQAQPSQALAKIQELIRQGQERMATGQSLYPNVY